MNKPTISGTADRRRTVAAVAAAIPVTDRPMLAAVDGGDGVGKTWFADELAEALRSGGRNVVRSSVDWFHQPAAYRHARGRSAETVWERSFDYAAMRRELLDPWRSGTGSAYRDRWYDLELDQRVDAVPATVPDRGVLVVDGVFVQRSELADVWDLTIWLEAPDAVRARRMAERDGVSPDPTHPDQARYIGAQRLYHDVCHPRERADIVIDQADLAQPIVVRLPH